MGHRLLIFLVFLLLLVLPAAGEAEGKKVFYLDSYSQSYPWSKGIYTGIVHVLNRFPDIEIKSFHMETKRNTSEKWKLAVARQASQLINEWQPDIVIASDDNASKYVIVPYYMNSKLPFIFCGVNWSAADYGFPAENVTGMIEVQLIDQILDQLRPLARGKRVAFLKGDDLSARKEASFYEHHFGFHLDKRFVRNFSQWKQEYLALQQEADILLLGNSSSVSGWDDSQASQFVLQYSQIPSGNWDEWMARFSLVTFANKPEEQGEWAARTALKVLNGTAIGEIPVTKNKKARILINMELARHLGVKFPIELIERARFTSE